ncbi:MAG: hypothetical protein EBU46_08975 [Nitrosomonadaceae bacterium]|nr:hypothetical protein [Nitrosomonadaceae bacterium]
MLLLWLPMNGMQLSKWTKYLHRDVFIYNGLFALMWILQTGFQGWVEQVSTCSRAVLVRSDVVAQLLEMTATASQFDQYSDEIFAFYGSALRQELADKKGLFLAESRGFHEGIITVAVRGGPRQSSGGDY